MKIHLKFNHDAECSLEALDSPVSKKELNEQLDEIINKFMQDEKYKYRSQLSELIHDNMDYSGILYMATKEATHIIEIAIAKRRLRDFLDEDEII